jgi:enoyl-CoA hydratase/carnithine racemase
VTAIQPSALRNNLLFNVLVTVDDAIAESRRRWPLACAAYEALLDRAPFPTVEDGLREESLVYSALQDGPEFKAWRAATPVKEKRRNDEPAVLVERVDDVLRVTLNRPERRNALGVEVRDGLLDALAVAHADPSLRVVIDGRGRNFCAGGDLDEFGTFPSPEEAHAIRLQTSIGAAINAIADRVTFRIHGACYGSGIELPAFASRVIAAPHTVISLPEIGLGLIPGAGGTVSMTARIGVDRMRQLGLSRQPIEAETALAWGLIDEIEIG